MSRRICHNDPDPACTRLQAFSGAMSISPKSVSTDLATVVERAHMLWTVLVQGAKELRDARLLDTAAQARDHSLRQLAWLTTVIEHEAPDAIAIASDGGTRPEPR